MRSLGQLKPILIRHVRDERHLVAGRHQLEAAKRIGWEKIAAIRVFSKDPKKIRLVQLSENICRAELAFLDWCEAVDDVRLTLLGLSKGAQVEHPGGEQPHDKGIKRVAKFLGISRRKAQDAFKVAGLPEEIKVAARSRGLKNNRDALLKLVVAPESIHLALRSDRKETDGGSAKVGKTKRGAGAFARLLVTNSPTDGGSKASANPEHKDAELGRISSPSVVPEFSPAVVGDQALPSEWVKPVAGLSSFDGSEPRTDLAASSSDMSDTGIPPFLIRLSPGEKDDLVKLKSALATATQGVLTTLVRDLIQNGSDIPAMVAKARAWAS